MPPPKGPTAYFVFSEQFREEVRKELQQQDPEKKWSVADVAKGLGARWSKLAEEEKEVYKARAQELKEKALASVNDENEPPAVHEEGDHEQKTALPVSVVRRLMLLDADVSRVSLPAVHAVSSSAKIFLEFLADKCLVAAKQGRRKTIKIDDVASVVKQDRRLRDVGLRDIIADICAAQLEINVAQKAADANVGGEGDGEAGGEHEEPASQRKKRRVSTPEVPSAPKITSFFIKQP